MPKKRYIVDLTSQERTQLLELVKKGQARARQINRAHILLLAAEDKTDAQIAQALQVGRATVERIRKKFVEGGLDWALNEHPRPGAERKLHGKQEALLIALAGSEPPRGRQCWTMQLLADRLVALGVVDALSDETVRRTLKKTSSSLG